MSDGPERDPSRAPERGPARGADHEPARRPEARAGSEPETRSGLDPDTLRLDAAVRAAYRAVPARDSQAEARVLARLARARPAGVHWWLESQRFELRPLAAVALLSLVLVAGAWGGARWAERSARARGSLAGAGGTAAGPLAARPSGVPVTFVLRAPGATSVCVVGDFNSWDAAATPLAHAGSGDLWIANVELPRGVHLYS